MSYGTNAPNGFQPVKKLDGSAWTGATNPYPITSGYATSLFRGDPVTVLNDGTIGIGVAGSAVVGVFWGCKYYDSTGTFQHRSYWPASTTVLTGTVPEAEIIDDPMVVFSVQETNGSGAAGTALALADVGLNINFAIGTGSTATGNSGASINNTTEATTDTLNCKLLALDPTPGNAVGSFANWLVTLNNHRYKAGVTGV